MSDCTSSQPTVAEEVFHRAPRSVVLSESLYPRNVGAVARAVGNMGFHRLVLVNRQCEIGFKAQQGAASVQKPLIDRVEYKSWDDFYASEGEGVVVALCPREGRLRQVQPLEETLRELLTPENIVRPWYFALGREDDGFATSELARVHRVCALPTFSEFRSLNVAQAALLTMFIFRRELDRWASEELKVTGLAGLASGEPLSARRYPDLLVRRWLEALGFRLDDQRINAFEIINRMILRSAPTPQEIHMLECVLQQDIRKLQEYQHYYQTVVKKK